MHALVAPEDEVPVKGEDEVPVDGEDEGSRSGKLEAGFMCEFLCGHGL